MKIDKQVLKQIAPTYGVSVVEDSPPVKSAIKSKQTVQGDEFVQSILTEGGYSWSDSDKCYKNNQQSVYILPTQSHVSVWICENLLFRLFDTPEKLKKWVIGNDEYPEGKVNSFFKVYAAKTGETTQSKSPERPVDKPTLSKADILINQAKKEAGNSGKLSGDRIIDLWQQAQEISKTDPAGGEKLIAFVKTLKSSTSKLEEIIRQIVKTIVNELYQEDVEEMTGTGAVAPITGKAIRKKKIMEKPVNEMSVTGGGEAYTIPGCFSRRGGSQRGLEGSEKLGYHLTPIGKKDMDEPADKLQEAKKKI